MSDDQVEEYLSRLGNAPLLTPEKERTHFENLAFYRNHAINTITSIFPAVQWLALRYRDVLLERDPTLVKAGIAPLDYCYDYHLKLEDIPFDELDSLYQSNVAVLLRGNALNGGLDDALKRSRKKCSKLGNILKPTMVAINEQIELLNKCRGELSDQSKHLETAIAFGELPEYILKYLEVATFNSERHTNERELIFESNKRLVVSIAKRYGARYTILKFMDLINEGNKGLLKATDRFDVSKGYKFSTYAHDWIEESIDRATKNTSPGFRTPISHQGDIQAINRAVLSIQREREKPEYFPSDKEVAISADLPLATVKRKRGYHAQFIPISSTIYPGTGDRGLTLDEVIEDKSASPEGKLAHLDNSALRALIQNLPPRNREILSLRLGSDDRPPMTLEEIGRIFGVTRERIRQIEEEVTERLKIKLKNSKPMHP